MRADYVARNLPVEVAASVAGSLGSRLPLGFESRTAYVAEERPLPKQAGPAPLPVINMFGSVQQLRHTVPRHVLPSRDPIKMGLSQISTQISNSTVQSIQNTLVANNTPRILLLHLPPLVSKHHGAFASSPTSIHPAAGHRKP